MNVEVNYLTVLAAAISSMIVGSIWYAPAVFGKKWQKLVKLHESDMKKGAATAMAAMFLLSLLTAYVLYHVTALSQAFFKDYSWLQASLSTAFWLWLGISFTRALGQDLFEQRPKQLTWLNIANQFVTLMVMGLVIGLMG